MLGVGFVNFILVNVFPVNWFRLLPQKINLDAKTFPLRQYLTQSLNLLVQLSLEKTLGILGILGILYFLVVYNGGNFLQKIFLESDQQKFVFWVKLLRGYRFDDKL
jgi:hypothetical protein